jgi:hypothetical protein
MTFLTHRAHKLLWHPVALQQISLRRDVAAGVGEISQLSQFDPKAAF